MAEIEIIQFSRLTCQLWFKSRTTAGFCPSVRPQLCKSSGTGIYASSLCNYTGIPFELEIADTVSSVVDGTLSLILGNLTDVLSSDWTSLSQRMSNSNDFFGHLEWSIIWIVFCCLFLVGFIVILLLSRVVALLCRRDAQSSVAPTSDDNSPYACWMRSDLQPNLLLPPFVFLVLVIWVFFFVYFSGLVGASDFCYESPDDRALSIAQQETLSPFMDSFLGFFVAGKKCREIIGRNPFTRVTYILLKTRDLIFVVSCFIFS